jgi:hypothetical protein
MKRVLLTVVAVALLIPSILMAAPVTVGVYFEGSLAYTPASPVEPFLGSLYMIQSGYYVTGVEYQLIRPGDGFFNITEITYPAGEAANLGHPFTGHSITYWPPLTGYPEGYDLLANFTCYLIAPCSSATNYQIEVGPDPRSGYLRGTYAPDNDFFDIVGLTSWLCPEGVATEEESWGAIKSMYR